MGINIEKALEEIAERDKEKIELELLERQLGEEKERIASRMKEVGIESPEDLEAKISELGASVEERLTALREGRVADADEEGESPSEEADPPEEVQEPESPSSSGHENLVSEDIMDAFEVEESLTLGADGRVD